MEAIIASAWAVFILLGIGAIGFFVVAKKIVPGEVLGNISKLAIEVAIPLFIFTNIVEKFDPMVSPGWWKLPLWWIAFAAVTLVLSLLFGLLFNKGIRREATVSLYLYNPTFFPLAIIIGIFGSDSPYIADLFLFTMLATMYYFNIYKLFFRDKRAIAKPMKVSLDFKKIFNPLVGITALALVVVLADVNKYIPAAVLSITGYIGGMAFPLIMVLLGGYVYLDLKRSGKFYFGQVIKYVAIKNLAFPLIMIGIVYLIHPDYSAALILVLSAAAPPLSSIPILVERQHGNTEITNQFLVASFLFSIVSVPATVMLLDMVL